MKSLLSVLLLSSLAVAGMCAQAEEVRYYAVPPGSHPHDVALGRLDPVTEKFRSFPSDRSGAGVRQILGRPGELWGAESGNDRLVVIRSR